MTITAKNIKTLLETRHRNNGDIFVDECKVGSSWQSGFEQHCYRLDAWAMKKSWTNPTVWGYEIKVSRSDFLNDNKWQNYLPYCTDFYFVCPKGLIAVEELDKQIGLITVQGSRLYTARKAVRRDVVIPEGLYRYLLMNRVVITREYNHENRRENSLQYWKEELKNIEDGKKLGWKIGEAIRQKVDKQVKDIEVENNRLQQQNNNLETVKLFCQQNGIDYERWLNRGKLGNLINQDHLRDFVRSLKQAGKQIDDCLTLARGLKDE